MLLEDYKLSLADKRWRLGKRIEILERDNYTCQHCQKKGGWLEVHHITRRPEEWTSPWESSNESLVTLCRNCHEHETFYGNDALRYLARVVFLSGLTAQSLESLKITVKKAYEFADGTQLKLLWSANQEVNISYTSDHLKEIFRDLANIIGRRFYAHPFTNSLAARLEELPALKRGSVLDFSLQPL